MADEIKLTPEAQQIVVQIQSFQQLLQNILVQKESIGVQNIEIDNALEELSKTKEGEEIYKAVGPILVKAEKENLVKELNEKKESIETKLKSFEKQEEKTKEKLTELQKKIQEMFSGSKMAE